MIKPIQEVRKLLVVEALRKPSAKALSARRRVYGNNTSRKRYMVQKPITKLLVGSGDIFETPRYQQEKDRIQ